MKSKRLMTLLVCAALSATTIFAARFTSDISAKSSETDPSLKILKAVESGKEEPVSELTVRKNEKVTLKTEETGKLQWYIQTSKNKWAKITGEEGRELTVSKALIGNFIGEDRTARIRLDRTVNDKTYSSNPIKITLNSDDSGLYKSGRVSEEKPVSVPDSEVIKTPVNLPFETVNEYDSSNSVEPIEEPLFEESDQQPIPEEIIEPEENSEPVQSDEEVSYFRNNRIYRNEEVQETPVQIRYLFSDDSVAAESWNGVFNSAADQTLEVKSPEISGYTADQTSVIFTQDSPREYVVRYYPSKTAFKVNIFLQNIDDNGYEFYGVENLEGDTGQSVNSILRDQKFVEKFDGFSALFGDDQLIARDGSTSADVHYDRNVYTLEFDTAGGNEIESLAVRYGQTVELPIPEKSNASFHGWKLEDGTPVESLEYKMPSSNKKLIAEWDEISLAANETAAITADFYAEKLDGTYEPIASKSYQVEVGLQVQWPYKFGFMYCDLPEHTHGTSCYCKLNLAEHSHSMKCYGENISYITSRGSLLKFLYQLFGSSDFDNPVPGKVVRVRILTTHYLIYINGVWYELTGTPSDTNASTWIQEKNCEFKDQDDHHHSADCLKCNTEEHRHSDGCFSEFREAIADPNAFDKYHLKESEIATVTADGQTHVKVYLDRNEYSIIFRYADSEEKAAEGYRTVGEIKKKWGTDITSEFAKISADYGSEWKRSTSLTEFIPYDDSVTSLITEMPLENRYYYQYPKAALGTSIAVYYVEDENGNYTEYYTLRISDPDAVVKDEHFLQIPGYTLNVSKTTAKKGGKLNGTKFYYDRQELSYLIEYVDESGNVLYPSETKSAKFMSTVTAEAKMLNGYSVVGDSTKSIRLEQVDSQTNLAGSIKFVYSENEVVINYLIPESCSSFGTVTNEKELLKVFSGSASGSTAQANPGYKFSGWYLDPECTIPVNDGTVSNLTIVPIKKSEDSSGNPFHNNQSGNIPATYYAKFEPSTGSLKINITGAGNKEIVLVNITSEKGGINRTDSVETNGISGSATIHDLIAADDYSVSVLNQWNYDLTASGVNGIRVNAGEKSETLLELSRIQQNGLRGYSYNRNKFGKQTGGKN